MPTIRSGNLNDKIKEHPETNGWIIGHFMDSDPYLKTENLEVKWAVHKKGYAKTGYVRKSPAKTIEILIKGKNVVKFPEINKEVVLSKFGDYVIYDAHEVLHHYEVLEDCIGIVIRWPSKE